MATILINSIVRETEKAILVNCPVSWNANAPRNKDLWFPKSVFNKVGDRVAEVADWFINKAEITNSFHGYYMYFKTL